MPTHKPATVRRSVALPSQLVNEVLLLAPPELRDNLNRLVIVSLQEFAARHRAQAFDDAMARMASDPAIRAECAAISGDFASADLDGLRHD